MDVEATAQALEETATPVDIPQDAPEPSMAEELGAAFDRITEGKPVEDEPDPQESEPEAKPAAEAAPDDMPNELKERWADIPSDVREAVVKSTRDLNNKLAAQGRIYSGIKPIQEAITQAAKDIPSLQGMTPKQIADDMLNLARVSHAFNDDPVRALMGLVDQHNLRDKLGAALGVQPGHQDNTINELRQQIAQQNAHIQRMAQAADPARLRETFDGYMQQHSLVSEVQSFAAEKEHWGQVEGHMTLTIPIAQQKLGEGASNKDVLNAAYDMAIQQFLPDVQAQRDAAASQADPARAQAAEKAKSVNVTGARSGKPRQMTEAEELAAAYDRAMRA